MSDEQGADAFVRYDGSVGQRVAATPPGGGAGEWFDAGEVRPLEAKWARELVQHGHFDLCLTRENAAQRFGLSVEAGELDGLTLVDVVVTDDSGEDDQEAPAVQFIVLDTASARALGAAKADAGGGDVVDPRHLEGREAAQEG